MFPYRMDLSIEVGICLTALVDDTPPLAPVKKLSRREKKRLVRTLSGALLKFSHTKLIDREELGWRLVNFGKRHRTNRRFTQ